MSFLSASPELTRHICGVCGFPIQGKEHGPYVWPTGYKEYVCDKCWNSPSLTFPDKEPDEESKRLRRPQRVRIEGGELWSDAGYTDEDRKRLRGEIKPQPALPPEKRGWIPIPERKEKEEQPFQAQSLLRDTMAGRVLNGYIEAARVKPLSEFKEEKKMEEEKNLDEKRKKLLERVNKVKNELKEERQK